MRRRGFVLGDVHFPFHHKIIISIALYLAFKGGYKYFVQIGDLHDRFSASRFPRTYNLFTPAKEREWCKYYADVMWDLIKKYMPDAEKYQLLGNHDVRPMKKILAQAPEFEEEMLEILHEDYTFDGVKTIYDPREELYIDDICFLHGYLQSGKHKEYNLKNVVLGHTHRGMTDFLPKDGHDIKAIFEGNAGYVADPYSKGLAYTMQKRATRWTWGCLTVDEFGPRFISLHPDMAKKLQNDELYQEIYKAMGGILSEKPAT